MNGMNGAPVGVPQMGGATMVEKSE